MEYVPGGELFTLLVQQQQLPENTARALFQQIVSAVHYCHRRMVVHRDLKPENLLLDSRDRIKIGDFGLSNTLAEGDFLRTSCGSPNYAAPEVISGEVYLGPAVDVWSLGVILYALLAGQLPFDDHSIPTLFRNIREARYHMPRTVSAGAASLIRCMLLKDPGERATLQDVRQHPWFDTDLPAYISQGFERDLEDRIPVRQDVLARVGQYGFDMQVVSRALRNNVSTSGTVLYRLILASVTDLGDAEPAHAFGDVYVPTFSRIENTAVCTRSGTTFGLGFRLSGAMDSER
ncbi:hypothetical protein KIPB_010030, partial [Kipferlia bialata]|eukprot:g10030.t1